jgi:hypothetical protein
MTIQQISHIHYILHSNIHFAFGKYVATCYMVFLNKILSTKWVTQKGRFITLLMSGKYSLSFGIGTNQHDQCYYCYNLNKAMGTYTTFISSKIWAVSVYL